MMKPIIAISCSFDEKQFRMNDTYTGAVERAGGIPVIVPYIADEDVPGVLNMVDGLLLSGGMDVDPKHYNDEAHPKTEATTPERDRVEFALFEEACRLNMPIFGICRGIQMINVALGGSLIQDIPDAVGTVHTKVDHPVTVEEGNYLYEIAGKSFISNSSHHQSIKVPGKGLTPIAWTEDGIIEAVKHERDDLFGVQWHPERMECEVSDGLFKRFVAFAKAYKEAKG